MSQTKQDTELKVFITTGDSSCSECGKPLGRHAWITLVEGKGALCLACADLDHLAFLPSGDAALTRRARKHSTLSAVVLKWSRARKRYERQGLLVEEQESKTLFWPSCWRIVRQGQTSTCAMLEACCRLGRLLSEFKVIERVLPIISFERFVAIMQTTRLQSSALIEAQVLLDNTFPVSAVGRRVGQVYAQSVHQTVGVVSSEFASIRQDRFEEMMAWPLVLGNGDAIPAC
jgi:hypothetical protein